MAKRSRREKKNTFSRCKHMGNPKEVTLEEEKRSV
jgi:hypothetical protein